MLAQARAAGVADTIAVYLLGRAERAILNALQENE